MYEKVSASGYFRVKFEKGVLINVFQLMSVKLLIVASLRTMFRVHLDKISLGLPLSSITENNCGRKGSLSGSSNPQSFHYCITDKVSHATCKVLMLTVFLLQLIAAFNSAIVCIKKRSH